MKKKNIFKYKENFWTTFEKMFILPTKFCVGINIFFKFVTAA